MKRKKFYLILLTIAFLVFEILNITFVAKVDPYEFGQLMAFLTVSTPILFIVLIISLIYEIKHTIKKDTDDLDSSKYDKKFKNIKIVLCIILFLSFVTSIIYIWPSILHHYFFPSLYIFSRFILIILTILTIYLSNKKWRYVNIVVWFIFVILFFMQIWKIGLISLNKNDTQSGNIHYNRDQINKKLDSIKKMDALETGNVNICFDQKDSDSQAYCVISLAEKKSDINLCDEVTKISYKRGEGAHISNKPQYYKSQCYFAVAKKTNDYEICNKMITEGDYHTFYPQCLTFFAVEKKDPSVCDLYSDYYKNINKKYDLSNSIDVDHIKQMTDSCKEQAENGKLW